MDRDDWNERYTGRGYVWEVAPNQFVETHLAGLEPGSAIDLAAGECRNAVWLATRGWQVTAVDFSAVGLDKGRRLAADQRVADHIEFVTADATTYQPAEAVDLVVISYFQASPSERRTALQHAVTWLRPGGTLFVVAHDRSNHENGYGGPSSVDRCYDIDTTVEALHDLDVLTAEVARRTVQTDAGPRVALDTLVIASRPTD
jgi:ubiquinone/menaquinone biosynthesis C-methylase UbiE